MPQYFFKTFVTNLFARMNALKNALGMNQNFTCIDSMPCSHVDMDIMHEPVILDLEDDKTLRRGWVDSVK